MTYNKRIKVIYKIDSPKKQKSMFFVQINHVDRSSAIRNYMLPNYQRCYVISFLSGSVYSSGFQFGCSSKDFSFQKG